MNATDVPGVNELRNRILLTSDQIRNNVYIDVFDFENLRPGLLPLARQCIQLDGLRFEHFVINFHVPNFHIKLNCIRYRNYLIRHRILTDVCRKCDIFSFFPNRVLDTTK
jgi:hypothetical protein